MGVIDATARLKREMRARMRAEREALGEDRRAAAREGLTARLGELVTERGARSLSCFLPTRNEPDVRGFLEWARDEGIETLLPSAREDGRLEWIRADGDEVRRGAFGIDEPLGERLGPSAVGGVDLMLVPAAAVDLRGNRLGWGRGYFDRCLAALVDPPPVFAVVFEHELVDRVPIEPHDAPVAGAVTPERIVVC